MRRRVRRKKGFTLLEVLLVCGILAVLAAVVLPNLMGSAKQAKIDATLGQIGRSGTIASALERFNYDCGKYPEKLEDLYRKPSYIEDDENNPRWKGPYMDGDPSDLRDPWGKPFNYNGDGQFNKDKYDLWSNGPNGKNENGGGDDVKNWKEK